jgi:hypothetical protein
MMTGLFGNFACAVAGVVVAAMPRAAMHASAAVKVLRM